jgi:transglutaminase-like putative cysteine protease
MTAKEIYNTKIGVCEHFTKLYNTLLVSIGIDAVKVVGYALDRTEEDNNTMKVKESHIEFSKGVLLENERHAWSIAKINGVWTPLDATWNMFEGHVPLSHIFSNYGNGITEILSPSDLHFENKTTKEIITFVS